MAFKPFKPFKPPVRIVANDSLVKIAEAAAILKMSKYSLYRAVRAGDFSKAPPPAFRRTLRWRRSDLDAHIARGDLTPRRRRPAWSMGGS